MNIRQIKDVLFKQATIFKTGGYRPTEEMGESWIGRVLWGKESAPAYYEPLLTLFVGNLPYRPKELDKIQLITVYLDMNVWNHPNIENAASFFKINCFETLDELQKIDDQSKIIKPFPLTALLIENDAPAWDSADFAPEIEDEILRLEAEEEIEYYEDIVENVYPMHKVGGYPSFIQSGVSFGEDYPFVFQISSDEKAGFNIVDSGKFYFFYNQEKQDWIVHYDFY